MTGKTNTQVALDIIEGIGATYWWLYAGFAAFLVGTFTAQRTLNRHSSHSFSKHFTTAMVVFGGGALVMIGSSEFRDQWQLMLYNTSFESNDLSSYNLYVPEDWAGIGLFVSIVVVLAIIVLTFLVDRAINRICQLINRWFLNRAKSLFGRKPSNLSEQELVARAEG